MAAQIEITVVRNRTVRVRGALRAWCDGCGAETRLITVEAAALVAGVPSAALLDLSRIEELHPSSVSGVALVCLAAVLNRTMDV